jgi:hypothetical protein
VAPCLSPATKRSTGRTSCRRVADCVQTAAPSVTATVPSDQAASATVPPSTRPRRMQGMWPAGDCAVVAGNVAGCATATFSKHASAPRLVAASTQSAIATARSTQPAISRPSGYALGETADDSLTTKGFSGSYLEYRQYPRVSASATLVRHCWQFVSSAQRVQQAPTDKPVCEWQADLSTQIGPGAIASSEREAAGWPPAVGHSGQRTHTPAWNNVASVESSDECFGIGVALHTRNGELVRRNTVDGHVARRDGQRPVDDHTPQEPDRKRCMQPPPRALLSRTRGLYTRAACTQIKRSESRCVRDDSVAERCRAPVERGRLECSQYAYVLTGIPDASTAYSHVLAFEQRCRTTSCQRTALTGTHRRAKSG